MNGNTANHICCLLLVLSIESGMGAPQLTSMISDDAIEVALKDKRYLTRQLKCALGEGPCDLIGKRLKLYAPLVLRGACSQCTEQETRQIKRVLSHIQRNYPTYWSKIINQVVTGQ